MGVECHAEEAEVALEVVVAVVQCADKWLLYSERAFIVLVQNSKVRIPCF